MDKPWKSFISVLLLIMALMGADRLSAQSGIFDRTGIIPGHGAYSTLSEESVDLFTGNLTLAYRDIFLAGADGLNIEVWRVYNSKILQDRLMSQPNPTVQAYPKSMLGIGWSMHMGMVHNATSNTPVIEFPDGRRETAFPAKAEYGFGSNCRITKDFLKFDRGTAPEIEPKLYFPNGIVWVFGNVASLPLASGSSETVYMVTRIEDPLGNFINIDYDSVDDFRSISNIADSMGREIRFIKSYQGSEPAKLSEIRIRNHDDSHDVILSYSVGSFSNGFYKLLSFTPPLLPPATYGYNDGLSNNYELTSVTTSFGGSLEYSYVNHSFFFSTTELDSKVVSQKRITFNQGEQAAVWDYVYPTYQGASSGTATVEGPEYDTSATHYAYQNSSGDRWKIGLQISQAVGDGSSSVAGTWAYHEISATTWTVLGLNMGTAKGPLVNSVTETRSGDSTLERDYYYLRNGGNSVKRYGLPTKISYSVNGLTSAKSYKELAYFYETHTSFKDRYMLSFVESDREKSGAGVLFRETINSYFDEANKWGALEQMKRWRTGVPSATYYTWNFTYNRTVPNVTITVDGPGAAGVSQVHYQYGVEKEVSTPSSLKYTRNISKYSYIQDESNQYGGTKSYVYDDLGRTTAVELRNHWETEDPKPDPFLTIDYNWRPDGENKVEITQGNGTVTRYWDGMGRDTGYVETGDGTTLYYRQTLDAEGRIISADSGGTTSTPEYAYVYDDSGRITHITDPVNKTTAITYSGHTRTVTDPENHATAYDYADLPGLPTTLTDAQAHEATYAYDAVGRLETVSYLGRTQSYEYDGLDHVIQEEHPETGVIEYAYDNANRLYRKYWGGAELLLMFDDYGQLVTFTGAETVTYGYNSKGAVYCVTGSSGWSRTGITYNDFGAVTAETVTIPGLGSKALSYEYDANGNLTKTVYPDLKESLLTFNGLGRPESLTFNSTSIVSSAAYGPNKIPSSINYGNDTALSSTFYANGTPEVVSLNKGSTPLYNSTYTYNGVGNITGISSIAPAPAMNATFGYDSLNRLTSAEYTSGDPGKPTTYAYEYDAYGNMLTVRHNGIIAFNKTYDAQNRINELGYQYDARGNLMSPGDGRNFIWDAQNRLRSVTDTSGQLLAQYAYDDRGLRIATLAPKPDIDVVDYPFNSNADFVSDLQAPSYVTFTIFNRGFVNLNLGDITFDKDDASMFSVYQQPASSVPPGQSTQLVVRFLPSSTGNKTARLLIPSNDLDLRDDEHSVSPYPYEINLRGYCVPDIRIGGVQGAYDFGTVNIGESLRHVFYLENTGTATLFINGTPLVEQPDGPDFYLEPEGGPLPSEIEAGHSASFAIRFAPTQEGLRTATLLVYSSDPDENPYTIMLEGTGQNGPMVIVDETALTLLSPNGGEALRAGSFQEIRWSGGEKAKCVKVEYSTDNGTSYRTIADRAANIGYFPWTVPEEASGSCLVRISDADGAPAMPVIFSIEFKFRVSAAAEEVPEGGEHFVFRAGIADPVTKTYQVAEVAFAPDGVRGTENLLLNHALGEIPRSEAFLGRWHRARVTYDMTRYTGSVWIDNELVLGGIPLRPDLDVRAGAEISFSRDVSIPAKLWIDDVEVGFVDLSRAGKEGADVAFRPLFKDNFNRYEEVLFPRTGGWATRPTETKTEENKLTETEEEQAKVGSSAQAEEKDVNSGVDDRIYASSDKSFRLEDSDKKPGEAFKGFSVPERVPYCVSAEAFAIVAAGDVVQTARGTISQREDHEELRRQKRWDDGEAGRRGPVNRRDAARTKRSLGTRRDSGTGDGRGAKMMSGMPAIGTFYLYAFDGRLLAEYDVLGQPVREYIHFGGQLVAEYRNVGSQLLYYSSDQINSTRIVTDNTGTVVYAAAHEPYGGIQKTWTSSYDPSLKFSGKQRDPESDLDYFGARYYDRSLYRFLSVDPMYRTACSPPDPQSWNLCSYCRGNPIRYIDEDGLFLFIVNIQIIVVEYGAPVPSKRINMLGPGYTHPASNSVEPYGDELKFTANYDVYLWNEEAMRFWGKDTETIKAHEFTHIKFINDFVRGQLARIEKKWQKEKDKNPEKALDKAKKSYERVLKAAEVISALIFDYDIGNVLERFYQGLHDINEDWIPIEGNDFMTWVFYSHWFILFSFNI